MGAAETSDLTLDANPGLQWALGQRSNGQCLTALARISPGQIEKFRHVYTQDADDQNRCPCSVSLVLLRPNCFTLEAAIVLSTTFFWFPGVVLYMVSLVLTVLGRASSF